MHYKEATLCLADYIVMFVIEKARRTGCITEETLIAREHNAPDSQEVYIRVRGLPAQKPTVRRVNYVLLLRHLKLCDSRIELSLVCRSSNTLSHKGLMGSAANRVLLAGSLWSDRRLSLSDTWQTMAQPGTLERRFGELLQDLVADLIRA